MHLCPQEIVPVLMVVEVLLPFSRAWYYTNVPPENLKKFKMFIAKHLPSNVIQFKNHQENSSGRF